MMSQQAFDLVVRNGTVAMERGAVTGCIAGTKVAASSSIASRSRMPPPSPAAQSTPRLALRGRSRFRMADS
jgi:hypothetical protein